MNVTSLELSKELYAVSGWNDTDTVHDITGEGWLGEEGTDWYPAYDLGYLLRKLPAFTTIYHDSSDEWATYLNTGKIKRIYADTPEDAAAKLCLELFKQGILKRES